MHTLMLSRGPRFLALFILVNALVACGFQLRGGDNTATVLPDDWKSMALIIGNPNSEFSRELISRFEVNGVTWKDRSTANYTLIVGGERFQQRNLSLNSEARAAEFELTMSANFSVRAADGSIAIAETEASVFKQMENDPRNVVGKSEEIRLVRSEMRVELAQQIMRRVGFFAASTQNTNSDPG
ncbi:MAG: LPS assembly lipoprotein LptE [Gammaproteobacteria bacterium]|nr:LPS assembly lipoprotein LptE [Gammaproteobacteria bacterium]